MARLTDWEKVRAEYELGATQSELSRKYGVSRKAIQKHIAAELWMRDVGVEIDKLTEAKVAQVAPGCDPEKRAMALAAAADAKAAILLRQRADWDRFRTKLEAAGSFDELKSCKITAETMRLMHEGECRAWGIAERKLEAQLDGGKEVKVQHEVSPQVSGLLDALKQKPAETAKEEAHDEAGSETAVRHSEE